MQNSTQKMKKNRKFNIHSRKNVDDFWLKFWDLSGAKVCQRRINVNLVGFVKSFPTSIYLQKSASIQPRTSPSKFGGKIQFTIHFTPYKWLPFNKLGSSVLVAVAAGGTAFCFRTECKSSFKFLCLWFRSCRKSSTKFILMTLVDVISPFMLQSLHASSSSVPGRFTLWRI